MSPLWFPDPARVSRESRIKKSEKSDLCVTRASAVLSFPFDAVNFPCRGVRTIHSDATLERLDPGEREAILLAEQLVADLVVLDNRAARRIALGRGLRIIGLLGIVRDAARVGSIDIAATFERLREVGFWVAPSLLQLLLEEEETP